MKKTLISHLKIHLMKIMKATTTTTTTTTDATS